jgi:hypothetical protein
MASDATITLKTRADLAGARALDDNFRALAASEQRLVRENIALAQSYARLQAAQGQAGQGAASLRASLGGLSAAPARSVLAVQTQIAQLDRTARGSVSGVQSLGGAFRGLQGAAATLGIGLATTQIIQFGREAGAAALRLDRVERTTQAIASSTTQYNAIVAEARRQQSLFGGTLAENLEQLSGFAVQARLSGTEVSRLTNIAQRLAVLDPSQGIAGASIALREALSGDPVSLARRFEIPKAALAGLRNESATTADRLRIVDNFLNKAGISADIASRTTSDTARAYNELGAALDDTKTRLGGLLAEFGKGAAINTTAFLGALNNSTSGAIAAKLDQARISVVATATSYEDYANKLAFVNTQLRGVTEPIAAVSRAQFDYAKSLQSSGVSAEDAAARAQKYAVVVDAARQASGDWLGTNTELRDRLLELAGTSEGNAAAVQNIAAAYAQGFIDIDRFRAALALLEEQQRRVTLANQEAEREQRRLAGAYTDGVPPIDKHNQALAEQITKSQAAKVEAQQLDAMQRNLASIGDAVRKGHISAADGAAFLADQYRITQGEARELLRLQGLVANVSLDIKSGTPEAGGDSLNRFLTQGQKAQQFAVTQAAAAKEAQEAQILALGTDKQKLSVLQQQYNQAVRIQGANSAAAIQARTALEQEKRRQAEAAAAEAKRGRAASNKGLGASDRADLSLAQAGLEGVDRLQSRLDEVNKKLESAKLTEQARKQLTVEKLELERKIGDALDKQRNAALDAQILAIKDRQERRQEQRRLEGAQRRLASGEFSEREKADAADVAELLPLEQEKRRREIEAKAREGGISVNLPPTPTLAAAAPGQAPTLPAQAPQPAQATTQPILIIMDGKQVAEIILPYQIAGMRSGRAQVQAAGG